MANVLETILTSLLQPDNAVIQQATAQLKEAVKDPFIIPALCDVLRCAQDPQIRQFAAVLLRRRLTKKWKMMPLAQQETVKSLLLEAITRETEQKVRYALAQLSAVVLRSEKLERWPQFIQFVLQASRSDVPEQRQVGLLLLRCAVDINAGSFRPHFPDLIKLFNKTLCDLQNGPVLFYTIQSVTSIVHELVGNETNLLRPLVPKLITAIKQLMQTNEVQASEAMEVFDEMIESEVSVIVNYLAEVIHFCLEIAVNTSLSDNLRVKSLHCICFLIKLKSKSILKQKLLTQILNAIFPIMCAEPPLGQMDPEDQDDEDEELLEEGAEVESPKHYAVQVIDILALHLPPEKLFSQLTPLMEPCLLSSNPYQRKAGLMCLAALSEGCADHLRNKYLQSMLQLVCQAITDQSHVVRNAALFALGQFSEFLQPEISGYSETVLPLLLDYLSAVDPSRTAHLTKAYYALENFVGNLGSKIEPYLPTLMERILSTLSSSNITKLKELSVSALGAIAKAAEELLRPFFPSVMEVLKVHLMQTGEEGRPVQIQCLETLGILVYSLGKETFLHLSEDCCLLGLNLCDRIDDPNIRSCAYHLFAALSEVMEESISNHLEKMTTLMLLSLKSKEGIVLHYNENRTFMLFDDETDEEDTVIQDEEEEDDEEDPDIEGFSVENAFVDEKEEACLSLGEIALNASSSFFLYLDSCFHEVQKHIESPHPDVRKSAYEALGKFVRSMNLVCQKNPSEPNAAVLLRLLDLLIPTYLHAAMHDKEHEVVMTVLESLNNLLKDVKDPCVREPEQLEKICVVINAVLQSKTACQDPEADDEEDKQQVGSRSGVCFSPRKRDLAIAWCGTQWLKKEPITIMHFIRRLLCLLQRRWWHMCRKLVKLMAPPPLLFHYSAYEAEMDAMLVEYAGEGIPLVATAVGGATFAPYFAGFLPLLLNKMKSSCTPAEKSFAGGILAESIVGLRGATVQFVPQLLPALISGAHDEDDEVRSNSVYGLGVLAEHGGGAMHKHYPKLLSVLSSIISSEKNAQALDNVCGAVSRMILSHPAGVPVEQVFPVMLRSLPLKEDFEENYIVFKCIAFLYENNPSQVAAHINDLTRIFGHVLGTKEIKPETEDILLVLLRTMAQSFPQDFWNAVMSLPAETSSKLRSVLSLA
ncbi:importin-4 isoform X1 [Pseudophryne corroboree]|uniref:importin-4 isoform X1 n=1 Tax=Pseudophryne corroboree TaxID=495146 RepID=UPI0030813DC5